ncbi:MAG: hypothetical protein WA840_02060 [Caulobacteraceae bacterium]
MVDDKVHYELFSRRKSSSPWTLEFATEDRRHAVQSAEELLTEKRAAAVRVTKEILDAETGEFRSIAILTRGDIQLSKPKTRVIQEDHGLLCVTPSDLYTFHARERIGRLLEGWLRRHRVTPFELLHRPDLIERLEASGLEIQHALQRVAVPEAQARQTSVHEVIRRYQKLVDDAIARVLADRRRHLFPSVSAGNFPAAVEIALLSSEPAYVLGGAAAGAMAAGRSWLEKVALLLDMAEASPPDGPGRALAFRVLEQPLGEILGSRGGMAALVGENTPDMGSGLALMTRLVAPETVQILLDKDPALARQFPPVDVALNRLARWLADAAFDGVRAALARRILEELNSPRRLHPDDPEGEIRAMRALARVLVMAGSKVVQPEEVQAAFVQRSKSLLNSNFVQIYLDQVGGDPLNEAQALIRLSENVVGGANKRAAGRWLKATVGALRFERDLLVAPESPAWKLAHLAELEHALRRVGLAEEDRAEIATRIGEVGGLIEADAKLVAAIGRAHASAAHRLMLLLKLVSGETAPLGAVSARAKAEAIRLAREPATRAELAATPDLLTRVHELMTAAGMAA